MRVANSILRLISIASAYVAALAVGVTAVTYVAEVVFRYGLNNPLNWSTDAGSYMLCTMVLLAVPLITRRRGHISVSVVLDILPEKARSKVNRLLELLTAAVLFVVAYFVIELCVRQFHQGVLTTMANQIPRWWLTGLMAFGLLLSALNFVAPADETTESKMEV